MRRSLSILLAALAVATALASIGVPPALAGTSWPCAAPYYATCYAPSAVQQAQRAMPMHPVNPSAEVFSATHLKLARVTISRSGFNTPPNAIFYIYGLPLEIDRPYPQTERKYLLVVEYPRRILPMRGMRLSSTKTGVQLSGTLRHHPISLMVYGNVTRDVVKTVGQALIAAR
jgi:hypothetical protein